MTSRISKVFARAHLPGQQPTEMTMRDPTPLTDLAREYVADPTSDKCARIVQQSLPLVHFVFQRLGHRKNFRADDEDVIEEGVLGMLEAIERFDPNRGGQLSTFAVYRIHGRMVDHLRKQEWRPRASRERSRNVRQVEDEIYQREGKRPSSQEISERLGLTTKQVRCAQEDDERTIVSLSALIENNEDSGTEFADLLADPTQADPADIVEEVDWVHFIQELVRQLSEREQEVIDRHLLQGQSFSEIGECLGISESRVSQIETKAARRIVAMCSDTAPDAVPERDSERIELPLPEDISPGECPMTFANIDGKYWIWEPFYEDFIPITSHLCHMLDLPRFLAQD
jgi:RNA polymerase sigma factor for flagellar operon FliA